jgi:hypothetical protein
MKKTQTKWVFVSFGFAFIGIFNPWISCRSEAPLKTGEEIQLSDVDSGPRFPDSGCPEWIGGCFDGTLQEFNAGCASGTPTCIFWPNFHDSGLIAYTVIKCKDEEKFNDAGVCVPVTCYLLGEISIKNLFCDGGL